MWLSTSIELKRKGWGGVKWARTMHIQCDVCGKVFDRKWGHPGRDERTEHFCGASCASHAVHSRPWSEERTQGASDRMTQRNMDKWSNPEERAKQSEKIAETHKDPVLSALRAESIRRSMSTEDYRRNASIRSTLNMPRAMASKARNNSGNKSVPEVQFKNWLSDKLGSSKVDTSPMPAGDMYMDVYILPVDTYIQFDGIHYHGLDMPYDQLTPSIKRKFNRDRLVDIRMELLGQRMLRVTDKYWESLSEQERTDWLNNTLLQYVG